MSGGMSQAEPSLLGPCIAGQRRNAFIELSETKLANHERHRDADGNSKKPDEEEQPEEPPESEEDEQEGEGEEEQPPEEDIEDTNEDPEEEFIKT